MMLAKFSQKGSLQTLRPLIDPGLSLSNHWNGMTSSLGEEECFDVIITTG
jgi:hypothetical protein